MRPASNPLYRPCKQGFYLMAEQILLRGLHHPIPLLAKGGHHSLHIDCPFSCVLIGLIEAEQTMQGDVYCAEGSGSPDTFIHVCRN